MAVSYSLAHLSDQALLHDLEGLVTRDRATTAMMLAHLAEVDERRLYLPAAYSSLFAYCVEELHMSEDAACRRIRAARLARLFPAIFSAVADGRLHLNAVVMLAPHLTEGTADELIAAASYRTRTQLEKLLAERFPAPDLATRLRALPMPAAPASTVTESSAPARIDEPLAQPDSAAPQHAPEWVGRRDRPSRLIPLAPRRYALQLTIDQSTHDDLKYALALLSHEIPSGDVARVLGRALKALIGQLEKRKFAATSSPRPGPVAPQGTRTIPAQVKRTVWERDGGRCTFVSKAGRRCSSRVLLEFDHIDEVARGGRATVDRMRLRCRSHNQYEAELTFGTAFMREKRGGSRRTRAEEDERLSRLRGTPSIGGLASDFFSRE